MPQMQELSQEDEDCDHEFVILAESDKTEEEDPQFNLNHHYNHLDQNLSEYPNFYMEEINDY